MPRKDPRAIASAEPFTADVLLKIHYIYSMTEGGFSWGKLDWKDFQRVSLLLYREDRDDPAIEEYLRQGHFQAGIDLFSFRQATGKYVCIQCKHSALSLAKLKAAVNLFLACEFADNTETFIVTTTAQMQTPTIQTWITQQKITFREQKGIGFDVWDKQRLESLLTRHYLIVEKYFGSAEAIANCFKPKFAMPELLPVPAFIARHIQPFKEKINCDRWHTSDAPRPALTLTDLLTVPADNKGICLIGEAYEGKSSLFRQTAWELGQLDLSLAPLILDLKFCSVLPIPQLLDTNFGTWRQVPAKDLVVLLDGLDEVPAEQFNTVAGFIRDFKKEHPAIRTTVSCRKMFYKYQNLEMELRGFEAYELLELHMRQIFDHLEPPLGGREKAMDFYHEMNALGIADLLGTPFYLINLTKWFTDPAVDMPKNKMDIANRFVDESLKISSTRRMRTGLSLDKYRVKYRIVLKQFALVLQIKGVNACAEDELQQLFVQHDIDLLTHSSILNIKGDQWSFINSIFQEQLAALGLQKLNVNKVIELTTLGDQIRKVSKKWIQTLATYLSLIPEHDANRTQVINLIEADNIELLALSEGSKFSQEFRFEVLRKILDRAKHYQAHLVVIDESDLAAFAGNADAVVDRLIGIINSDVVVTVRIIACRTLRHLQLTEAQADRYSRVAKALLPVLQHADLGRLLLEALAHYPREDSMFLSRLLQNPALEHSHEFRQGFYQYLSSHKLVDQYYDWLLNGFEPLRHYKSGTLHFGSEKRLLDILLTTRDRSLVSKLLDVVKSEAFQEQFRHDKDGVKQFYYSLTKTCAEIYRSEPAIIFSVVNYLAHIGGHHYDGDLNELSEFLELTQTHALALRIVLLTKNQEVYQKYAHSGAMHPACFGELFYAIEENELDQLGFRILSNGLYHTRHADYAIRLEQMGEKLFGLVQKPDPKAEAWRRAEERKRKNDLLFICSRAAFREAVIQLFELACDSVIKTDILYQRFDDDNPMNSIASNHLRNFVTLQAEAKTASLQICMEAVNDDVYFNGWRGHELFHSYLKHYYPEEIQRLLQSFYQEQILCFPFAKLNTDGSRHLADLAEVLMKIWAEYQWSTSDDTLLEFSRINLESYGGIHFAEVNKHKSVTALLIKHFADRPHLLKAKVLKNLAGGLRNFQVIGTQFEICRELKIKEALPYLLDAIKHKKSETHHEDDYMSLYIAFGGCHAELLAIFEGITKLNDYLFMFMVKLLAPVYPEKVASRLLECLRSTNAADEGKKVEAAQRLAQMGNREGFLFLINKLKAGKTAPFDIQGKIAYWNVDTRWGLDQVKPLMFLLLDEKTEALPFYHSPKYLVLEILSGFSTKSEAELILVTSFMHECANELGNAYPKNFGHLSWHAEQLTERYRQINIVPPGNKKIRELFQAISDS